MSEISFINTLEAQNKKIVVLEKYQVCSISMHVQCMLYKPKVVFIIILLIQTLVQCCVYLLTELILLAILQSVILTLSVHDVTFVTTYLWRRISSSVC